MATIVFGEHVVLAAITLPFLVPALVAVFGLGRRYVLAAVMIGAGASAVATILFTQAFVDSANPITPVVLQKVQPLVAVIGAWFILRERPRPLFGLYLAGGLVGTWLMAFRARRAASSRTGSHREAGALRARRRVSLGVRDGARALPDAPDALPARDDTAVRVRAPRERAGADRPRRARLHHRRATSSGSRSSRSSRAPSPSASTTTACARRPRSRRPSPSSRSR